MAVEQAAHNLADFLGRNGLGEHLGEPDLLEPRLESGVANVGQANHRGAQPELVAHDGHRLRVEQRARKDDDVGLVARHRPRQVVHGRHDKRLDIRRALEQGIQPDGRLDIRKSDEYAHRGTVDGGRQTVDRPPAVHRRLVTYGSRASRRASR